MILMISQMKENMIMIIFLMVMKMENFITALGIAQIMILVIFMRDRKMKNLVTAFGVMQNWILIIILVAMKKIGMAS